MHTYLECVVSNVEGNIKIADISIFFKLFTKLIQVQ